MHCPLRASALLAITLIVSAPRSATAQTEAGLRILALPEGQPIICRVPAPRPGGPPQSPTLVRRDFIFAPPSTSRLPPGFPVLAPRGVMATWDSTGRPVMLNDQASQLMHGAENVTALFRPDGTVVGRRIDMAADSARIADALTSRDPVRAAHDPGLMRPPVSRDLTPDEGARARVLAAWLWARRCRGA